MVRSRFYEIHNRLINEGQFINPQIMKNHYFGMVEKYWCSIWEKNLNKLVMRMLS